MTCRSCEARIERTLGRLPNIVEVSASAPRGRVEVVSLGRVSSARVERAIEAAGYDIGDAAWVSSSPAVWGSAALGIVIVVALALAISVSGLSDLAGRAGSLSSGGIVVALLLGLAAGVSTCMALVGGLVLALSATYESGRGEGSQALSPLGRFRPSAAFVGGRIVGYGAFGALLGAIGATLTPPPVVTAVMMVVVALVMTIVGMRLTGLSPRIAAWSPTLPSGLANRLGVHGGSGAAYSDRRAAALGAASFFLPCGFTQAVQIYALSTGSPLVAGLITATFAIGTAPGLLALAGIPAVVPSSARPALLRFVGVIVLAFALVNANAGLRLAGIEFPPPPAVAAADADLPVTDDLAAADPADSQPTPAPTEISQIGDGTTDATPAASPTAAPTKAPRTRNLLHTYQKVGGYSPANAKIYAGIPTTWTIDSESDATCAAYVVIPSLDMQFSLHQGRNTVQLPALRPGTVQYMCGMGMYTASITVVAG